MTKSLSGPIHEPPKIKMSHMHAVEKRDLKNVIDYKRKREKIHIMTS